jgi:hypothetical protein
MKIKELGAASGYQTKGLRKRSLLTAAPAALAVAITISSTLAASRHMFVE